MLNSTFYVNGKLEAILAYKYKTIPNIWSQSAPDVLKYLHKKTHWDRKIIQYGTIQAVLQSNAMPKNAVIVSIHIRMAMINQVCLCEIRVGHISKHSQSHRTQLCKHDDVGLARLHWRHAYCRWTRRAKWACRHELKHGAAERNVSSLVVKLFLTSHFTPVDLWKAKKLNQPFASYSRFLCSSISSLENWLQTDYLKNKIKK